MATNNQDNAKKSLYVDTTTKGIVAKTTSSVPFFGAWQAVNGTKCEQPDHRGGRSCETCLKALPPGSGLHYCSTKCRLRAWALRELMKALHDGTVDGLEAGLRELARMMGFKLD